MFTAVVHAVWITAIPIVGATRDRLYEYQDFKAILRRWLAALHLAFRTTLSEETPVPIRRQSSWSELTKTEKETMDAVRQGSRG